MRAEESYKNPDKTSFVIKQMVSKLTVHCLRFLASYILGRCGDT